MPDLTRITGRQIAGVALLSTIPAAFIVLAALAGQLAEMAIGVGLACGLSAAMWFGIDLLTKPKERNR